MSENSTKETKSSSNKKILGLVGAFALAAAIGQSFVYTVQPSEKANLRRLGEVVHEEPKGEGLQFKFPLIDTVDKLQVNLRTLEIERFTVPTVDNQQVTLEINFNYTVPDDAVNKLLYQVGKSGSSDIDSSIEPVAMDRAARIFATKNTTNISRDREAIQQEVTESVFDAVKEQFGIEPHSLQIAKIEYSNAFVKSNEAAVRAKNDAVKEKNKERAKAAQAEQAVILADGQAKADVEYARGDSESKVIISTAKKDAFKLDGEAAAAMTQAGIEVFGSPEKYLEYLQTKAELKWDGQRPQVTVTGGGTTAVVVPKP